ncbi:hypothetical protein ACHAWO_006228 [Cyclotella atomus]|uniref:Glycosyltransferase 61 catalytic domain-containing protein n=1 Tax=Cyclotella atomus TaxID=382360 RepID=A0ABD3QZG8_9STRA
MPYDWIMHQVLCREEFMCTSSFIWTLESVAGREPDYGAFGVVVGSAETKVVRDLKATESSSVQQMIQHPTIPKQTICNYTHEDIRSASVHWYHSSINVNIEMYPIGKKTVGVQIIAPSSKPASMLREHVGRKALRAQQLNHLHKSNISSFPKMNMVPHAEKAPNYDQYLGCDNEYQTPNGTALLVTQNFGCNNLWYALANHHGVWTLLKVLDLSPSNITAILPTEYGTVFASLPHRTVADILWPLSNGENNNMIRKERQQPEVCYMSRQLRKERVRYFSQEFEPIIEDVLDTWAVKHSATIKFKRLSFDDSIPFSEQIEKTSSCSILFGTHGAGLGHMLWMRSGASVIEIGGKFGCELYYRAMTSWYDHDYICFSDLDGHGVKLDGGEVYQSLNMSLLLEVLENAVQEKVRELIQSHR